MRNPNSYGGIVKLSGNRRKKFAVRITTGWTDDGKQIFKYLGYYEKRQDAIIALAEYNKAPYSLDSVSITFEELYELWSKERFSDIKKSTIDGYRQAYKHSAALHKMKFKDIKKDHLQDVLDNSNLAATTQKLVKNFHSQIFNFAIEKDIVDKNYAKFTKVKAAPTPSKRSEFTQEEIDTLLKNPNVERADTVLIMLFTGMRISELLEMKKEDVHLEERYMRGGVKTKAGINRVIPINEKIVPLIQNLLDNTPSDYLVTNTRGGKMSYVNYNQKYWKDTMDYFGFKHNCHDCRHTFISMMDRTDVNKIVLKRIVGHSAGNDITEHYTHKTIEELVEAVNKI